MALPQCAARFSAAQIRLHDCLRGIWPEQLHLGDDLPADAGRPCAVWPPGVECRALHERGAGALPDDAPRVRRLHGILGHDRSAVSPDAVLLVDLAAERVVLSRPDGGGARGGGGGDAGHDMVAPWARRRHPARKSFRTSGLAQRRRRAGARRHRRGSGSSLCRRSADAGRPHLRRGGSRRDRVSRRALAAATAPRGCRSGGGDAHAGHVFTVGHGYKLLDEDYYIEPGNPTLRPHPCGGGAVCHSRRGQLFHGSPAVADHDTRRAGVPARTAPLVRDARARADRRVRRDSTRS